MSETENQLSLTRAASKPPARQKKQIYQSARLLQKDKRITWLEVRAVNRESIHNRPAFAVVVSK
jgi:hypothetical protein